MAYMVEQKVGKHIYVYETVSYWDKAKKQPRQKRRCLGRKDPETGKIIESKRHEPPRISSDFGHVFLLLELARRNGLLKILETIFGPDAGLLLMLAFYHICEARPLYLYEQWSEGVWSWFNHPVLSSPRLSRFAEDLGRNALRETFVQQWLERHGKGKALVYDMTSLSTWSNLLELAEWGYNRAGEALPQMNLGLVCGAAEGMPLAYRLTPGSIADVSTLKFTAEYLKEHGLRKTTFVLDRGFYSQENLAAVTGKGFGFVMPLPFSSKPVKTLLSSHRRQLHSPANGFLFEGHARWHLRTTFSSGRKQFPAHLFFDETRKADENERLMQKLVRLETEFSHHKFHRRQEVSSFLASRWPGADKLFSVSWNVADERFELKRRVKALSALAGRMGHTIMLTDDSELSRDECLLIYQRRDQSEKLFDILKNELKECRIRSNNRDVVEGRIFLNFLALIVYSSVDRVMKVKELYKNWTVTELLMELKKIKLITLGNGKMVLTEISKKQRTLLQDLGVELPPALMA